MRYVPCSELDSILEHFDEGYKISHDEAYKRFSEVFLLPPKDLPADPFSDEYAEAVLDLYKSVSSKAEYLVKNERCSFDIESHIFRPYPYFTKSLIRTSQHYDLIAKLFNMLDVPAGGSILECGIGWGNTTLALGMLGYNITALDIEPHFCELVERRAKVFNIDTIRFVNSDFLWVENTMEQFDAVIYFESFHHCWEFERLLKSLHKVIKRGGKIYFGAEPIINDFSTPWCIRLDGESLFVARRNGWMELGFREDFFMELLKRTGWRGKRFYPHFWAATRRDEPLIVKASENNIRSACGKIIDGTLYMNAPGDVDDAIHYAMYGPYIHLHSGSYKVSFEIKVDTPRQGVKFDICHDAGRVILYSAPVSCSSRASHRIEAEFTLEAPANDLELRLAVPSGFIGSVNELQITEIYEHDPY